MSMFIQKDAVNFNGIVTTMQDIQDRSKDTFASNLRVIDGTTLVYNDEAVSMSDFAFSQCCTHMGVPTSYMNRCLEKKEVELVNENLNSWLSKSDKTFLLREYEDHDGKRLRGMLTERYTQFDAPDILSVIGEELNVDDYEIVGHYTNEERLHIRMRTGRLPIEGEDLFGGLTIDSSDVGRCGFRISYFIYKQICTNGLCISKGGGLLYSQKHIGITSKEVQSQIAANIKNLPYFEQEMVNAIKRSKGSAISELEMEKIFTKLKTQQKIGDKKVEKIISLMDERYDRSRFGLINGITEVAQDYSLDKRIELERFAGSLLLVA